MAHPLIDKRFYEAILHFEESEEAQETYYAVMASSVERNGRTYSVRDQILRAYAMLFCDDIGAVAGQMATVEDVEATADRLYVGQMAFDPKHWYRMQHHFPVIDEDNYERFAALVIADLNAGPLHDSAADGEGMLLVGELNPLAMSAEERQHQKLRTVSARALPSEGGER
ncbi:MAG: hypothetical protein IJH48_04775 [Oscillospiraceae bacterium]|nr:hypothetical protein [Oscillospiraceae bacterium]